ncbi:hypothetical protein SAMN05446037_1006146 [Anaerovirgula multivorans]|uniref:Uncharacterized protein n=1 Tax=Anaerovirgula multivorans TaxID=312168 RepID=A0A239CTA8_9FIRM|nr:hypothetical protein [Anaerovirgula multivorans]SNS23476.1 hypothetical protein SAMN05446037_1006146 [Anaerovirgula multivorans]
MSYVGIIKLKKQDVPYEEIEGFRYDTGSYYMDTARDIFDDLCSNLSVASSCQVRWEFEGIGQGHYCDDWYFGRRR